MGHPLYPGQCISIDEYNFRKQIEQQKAMSQHYNQLAQAQAIMGLGGLQQAMQSPPVTNGGTATQEAPKPKRPAYLNPKLLLIRRVK